MVQTNPALGYTITEEVECTIESGGTVSNVKSLGRNCAFIGIACEDTTGIPATATFSIKSHPKDTGTLRSLYEQDAGSLFASEVISTPTYQTMIVSMVGMRRVEITLSEVTTQDVVFKVFGIDSAKEVD